MKNIVDRIVNTLKSKNHKEENIYALCRNASGELSTYCSKEFNN